MKKRIHKVMVIKKRLSFKWVLICMAVILPINILASAFCVITYNNNRDFMMAAYQKQLDDFADSMSTEMEVITGFLEYYFSTDAINIIASMESRDPSLNAVAFKKALNMVRATSTKRGFSYEWDHTNDLLSVFNYSYNYGYRDHKHIQEQIRNKDNSQEFGTDYDLISIEGAAFIGCNYRLRNYTLGLYIDVTNMLAEYYDNSIIPEGTVALVDEEGNVLCSVDTDGVINRVVTVDWKDYEIFLESPVGLNQIKAVYLKESNGLPESFPWTFYLLIVLTGLSFLMIPLIYLLSNRLLINPLKQILTSMQQVSKGDLSVRVQEDANSADIRILNQGFNQMVSEIENLKIKVYEQEINQLKMEAINLKLQVNPHMFLNSLNTIYSLGRVGKSDQVCDFSALLTRYFRYLLRSDAEFATVKEEMGFVDSYLKIQNVRYPGRFVYSFSIEEEVERYCIPRLIIQNFVENTVKYGVVEGKEIEIIITVRKVIDRLIIAVVDTGNGISEEILDQIRSDQVVQDEMGQHTGIWNTRRRLNFYYQNRYEFNITSRLNEGTQVWLAVPVEE